MLSNPATLAGTAVLATVAGFSTLFFAYKSDTASKNEVVYQNDVLKTARLGDKIDLLTGKNRFRYQRRQVGWEKCRIRQNIWINMDS